MLRQGAIEHRTFRDFPQCLREGDLLVVNETRVIPARIVSDEGVELLLLRPAHRPRYEADASVWHALVRPGRKMREGSTVRFGALGSARVVAILNEGIREVAFALTVPFENFLDRAGRMPLPPYIQNDSAHAQERYQTIFARERGSVAAPTASLHFTPRVFDDLRDRGVQIERLVLDVGLGTFRPMKSRKLEGHRMHAETFAIPAGTAREIARAKTEGRRVVAAGTTVVRALEAGAAEHGTVREGPGETDLFITPGFRFRIVDALLTNFHLPQSTLLVLVSAFAGRDRVLHAYEEAIERGYRFFSFGDAMFIEP